MKSSDIELLDIDPQSLLVAFKGESIRVSDIEEVADFFRKAVLNRRVNIVLDLQAVKTVDITFFQLILAAKKSLAHQGLDLQILPLPPQHPVRVSAILNGLPSFADEPQKDEKL